MTRPTGTLVRLRDGARSETFELVAELEDERSVIRRPNDPEGKTATVPNDYLERVGFEMDEPDFGVVVAVRFDDGKSWAALRVSISPLRGKGWRSVNTYYSWAQICALPGIFAIDVLWPAPVVATGGTR